MQRPNILYIHSHDTGRYIQPHGHAVATPHLQRLAEQGVLFRRAFCAAPTCSPSRAALLAGQWAHGTGMLGLAHRGFELSDYRRHVIHTLRRAGYVSALAGVQHITVDVDRIGYDRVLTEQRDAACAEAVRFLAEPPAEPFFLSVGFFETHRRFPPPDEAVDERYVLPPAPLPDAPQTRLDMADYHASARRLDDKIGAVLDALDEHGLADRTLVIATTDHGIAFPAMKCGLTDHGIGVFLIMRGPGGFTGGRVCDAMVSQVDLFPTLCDLLAIDPPSWLAGKSMMPLIRDDAEQIRDELFAEVSYHAAYEPQRCVRTLRWKYIRQFDDRRRVVLPNCDDGESKTFWTDSGWSRRPVDSESLYDLVFDPHEADNVAGQSRCDDVLHDMRHRLERWMAQTRDPLLDGPIPPPSGAVVTDADAISPAGG